MVVGIRTVTQATIARRTGISSEVANSAHVPVADITMPGARSLPQGVESLMDIRVSGLTFNSEETQHKFVAPGEQIIAVQYRKVVFKWYSSRSVDRDTLESGSRWILGILENREESGFQSDCEDVVEVSLRDFTEIDLREIVSSETVEVIALTSQTSHFCDKQGDNVYLLYKS